MNKNNHYAIDVYDKNTEQSAFKMLRNLILSDGIPLPDWEKGRFMWCEKAIRGRYDIQYDKEKKEYITPEYIGNLTNRIGLIFLQLDKFNIDRWELDNDRNRLAI